MADALVYRVKKKNGARQLVFLPGLVLKIGRNAAERRAIEAERLAGRSAERTAFWRPLVAKTLRLGSHGFLTRRFRPARAGDFRRVAGIVEDRLTASLGYPPRPILSDLMNRPLFRHLAPAEREALTGVLDGRELPATSMHGDLHLFNFARAGDDFRIIDWEQFDPDGTYVYDYLDFFISADALEGNGAWMRLMRELDATHPALRRASDRFGISPRALLLYYLFLRCDIMVTRRGGFAALPQAQSADILAGLRSALAA